MPRDTLALYDPEWRTRYDEQYSRLCAVHRAAVEDPENRRKNVQEFYAALQALQRIRYRQFPTVADVARYVLEIVQLRAAIKGGQMIAPPEPEDFRTLADVRRFLADVPGAMEAARREAQNRGHQAFLEKIALKPGGLFG